MYVVDILSSVDNLIAKTRLIWTFPCNSVGCRSILHHDNQYLDTKIYDRNTKGGPGDSWFDWPDSLTEIFTNSTLAGFLNLSIGSSLDNSVQLQHMLSKGIYKRSKIRLTGRVVEIFRCKNYLSINSNCQKKHAQSHTSRLTISYN